MTADVFRRLALVAGCSAWAVAIALVWIHVHWVAALAALVAGPAGAFALTLESAADPKPTSAVAVEEPPRGLGHREIARRARDARGDDEE